MKYENILVEIKNENIGIITLNRPKAYNALSTNLILEVSNALKNFDEDENIAVVILTGANGVFAAGADIKELAKHDFASAYNEQFITKQWSYLQNRKKPLIAAVSGYALGGGCELALLCDIVICDESAKFGQPEVNIGTMPGIGGTQRLTKAVGKSKAMLMCLTGDMIDANEAKSYNLVALVSKEDQLLDDAIKIASKIASKSQIVVRLIKESINNSFETSLEVGLQNERNSFYSTFSLEDKTEGMSAFIEKRKASFKNK